MGRARLGSADRGPGLAPARQPWSERTSPPPLGRHAHRSVELRSRAGRVSQPSFPTLSQVKLRWGSQESAPKDRARGCSPASRCWRARAGVQGLAVHTGALGRAGGGGE